MSTVRKVQQARDGIPMMGTVALWVRDAKTNLVLRHYKIRNKITLLTADVLVELIAQRSTDPVPGRNLVYSMRMGSSNTAATRADTNLGAYIIGKVLADVNKVTGAPGEITFTASLDTTDANGQTLREAALFSAGATPSTSDVPNTTPGTTRMLARQVHPDVPKTSAISVDYAWTIAFTATP